MPLMKDPPPAVDTSKPSIARVYDVLLGGSDNFESDRALCERLIEVNPELPDIARHNRRWLARVVRWLAREARIDQFLDVGSGLPSRALLAENALTHFCAGDLTRPGEIVDNPAVREYLDFDRPIALLQLLTLHQISDEAEPRQLMADYIDRLPSGSYVALTHARRPAPDDEHYARFVEATARYKEASSGFSPRTQDEITSLLDGLELVEPGVVGIDEWWPEGPTLQPLPYFVHFLSAAVARKP